VAKGEVIKQMLVHKVTPSYPPKRGAHPLQELYSSTS
jgi:hypothetical protein